MCAIQILISIIPIWIYLRFMNKQVSYYLGLDVPFVLKRWWALWCISKKEKTRRSKFKDSDVILNIKKILEPCSDNSKIIMNENSCDSISFYGADQKGNSLFVKMTHRGYHKTELILQVTLSDSRVYVLPDCPDTITVGDISQNWSASGLKIEFLEPRQRWRITYNGFLRNQCRGNTSNNDNVEHIRLNFIFIGKPRPLEWPGDWSIYLHADALAREPWKNSDWMHKIQLIDDTGFDLWGSIIGQITFKDSNTSEFYLRGLCQRRWGKHESYQFHKTITIVGVTQHGAMYYFGMSNTKHSFSHMQFGHLQEAGGMIAKIDWIDLQLSDFEKEDTFSNYKIVFTAAGKQYSSVINNYLVGDAITYYNDQPWAYTTRNLRVQLNGSTGIGLMITCCSYTGPRQIQTSITKIQRITQPDTFAQKNKYILHFDDKQCQNESVVGGKGYSLAILTSIDTDDFAVPPGFCVTSLALERQLQHHKQLQNLVNDIIDISCCKKKEDLESCCQKAVSIIQGTPVEKEIAEMILQGLKELELFVNEKGVWRYAIRSSAIGEDSEETSAAGQNSTYLGVKNTSDVIECVAKCWASLFSYQSVEYRRQNGLPIRASMGVCIQRMVDAEAAGVMFTRHPTTGDPSSMVITANYGLGETVVLGKIEPDTFIIHRKWDNTLTIDSSVLGNKEHKILLDDRNGVITSALSEQEIKKISISDTSALRLAKIGLHLESLFGSARDVEWAIIDEQIYMLQARPITTINAWTDFEIMHELDSGVPCDVDLMTFANIGEVLPYPISPLSISTIIKVLNLSLCAKFNKFDCYYLHMVGMRCAMNYLDSTLQDVSKEMTMMNKMIDLAICGRVVTTPELHAAAIEKYGIVSEWRRLYIMYETFITAWKNDALVKKTINIFNKYTLDANEFDTPHDLYNTLNEKYGEIFLIGKGHNMASLVSVSYQMMAMSFLTNGSDNFTSEHLADIAVLLSSCNVISTEVPIALGKIAACIRRSGKADEFSKLETAKVITWLELNCPPAAEKLQLFFKMHGHRCVHELDFFTEPWLLKPDNIINTIQVLAMSIEENYMNKKLSVEETLTSLKTSTSSIIKCFLRKIIPLCRKAVTLREMTKNVTISALHILRLAYRRLGVLMVTESYIPNEQLIFFLTHQEIGQLLNNHNQLLVRKALRRRKIYQKVAKFEYPEFSTGMPVPIEPTFDASSYEGCTKIEGTSVCGGSVLGRACVITDLSEVKIIQHGDILITHCTDIGWSPYFPFLAGIVTELGGLISHGAVVAREYGLPCIVGAKGATHVFQTNDTVLLAGDVGTIQLIEKA